MEGAFFNHALFLNYTRIFKNWEFSRDWSLLQQVDVFPYLKTRRLCVLLHYLNYHWYNGTVKINHLIKFNN